MTHSGSFTQSAGTERRYRPRPHSWSTTLFPLHQEEWRPVVGFEGRYEVSDMGQIRPVAGLGRLLKPYGFGKIPYLRVCIRVLGQGNTNVPIHRAVCEAFHGPKPVWADCVRHLNDDSYDNRAVNLAWGTHADNMQDRLRNGGNPEARRDACDRDHPYVEGSFSIYKGWRRCLVCHRDKERARQAAKRAAAHVLERAA